jgi:translation initiation factor 1
MRERPKIHVERGEPLSPTQQGRLCPRCGRLRSACDCKPGPLARTPAAGRPSPAAPGHPADGVVRVARESKGRKGKGVTLVRGLRMAPAELEALCRELKQRCGAGGTVKDGVIEIQGDHRDTLIHELEARGHTVKRAGA